MRIDKLEQAYDIDVQLVHFPLHPDTPMEGRALDDLFAGRGVDMDAMYARMKGLMEAEGLPYGKRTHTYNSRLAQELGKWADTQEGGYAIHDALYRAYFVDARNIGDIQVLMDVVRQVGLPEQEAREVLEQRKIKDAVDQDWGQSHPSGVTGVPTFSAGGYGVVGAQPYEAIEELVKNAGAQPRAQT